MVDPQLVETLPPPSTTRWTAWRKRAVVIGVREGAISPNEASDRYNLSREELAYWGEAFDRRGIGGLLSKNRSPTRSTTTVGDTAARMVIVETAATFTPTNPPASLAPEELI